MSTYDPKQLDEMCQKIDLLDYASQSMDFVNKGQDNYFTSCPLHIDKTPSLSINQRENKFYCFSCHKGGAIIQWLMLFEHLSYVDAVKKIVALTNTDLANIQQNDTMSFLKSLHFVKSKHPQNREIQHPILDMSVLGQYPLAAPKEWLDEGITAETMQKFNIRIDNQANRIVYPIYDDNFNLIGIKGRTRYPNYKILQIPKYMNYYKLGNMDFFCGMKEQFQDNYTKPVFIFEGLKSVMKAYQWGYFALSAETSYLNDYQIEILLKRGFRDITIAFDTDVDYKKIIKNVSLLKNFSNVFFIYDANGWLGEKESPVDQGKEIFESLLHRRRRVY